MAPLVLTHSLADPPGRRVQRGGRQGVDQELRPERLSRVSRVSRVTSLWLAWSGEVP